MFVTNNHHKHPLSGILGDQQTIWHVVDVELQTPWFLIELEAAPEKGENCGVMRTMLVARPNDVIQVAQLCASGMPRLHSVAMMSADATDRPGGWTMHPMAALWDAVEPDNASMRAHIFEKVDGSYYVDSLLGTTLDDLRPLRLLASFPGAQHH